MNRLRRLRLAALDLADALLRRRKPLTPSRIQIHDIGGFDFHEVGRNLAKIAIEHGRLQPHERILDVGCGFGRLAVPLLPYLTRGEYAGFDLDRRAIRWCQRTISAGHANFWFAHADIANTYYNPRGTIDPTKHVFPCADESVDVVFASSVFTHLLPATADHSIWEIARVLKAGGRAVVSFFLLDDAIRERLLDPLVQPRFAHAPEAFYAIADPRAPEAAIAYDADTVRDAFAARGLNVTHVERGSWRAIVNPLTYQDLVVAEKSAPPR